MPFPFMYSGTGNIFDVTHDITAQGSTTPQYAGVVSNLARFFPANFTLTRRDYVFFANGLMRPRKWNGVLASAVTVGVDAPTTAITLATPFTTGPITGTYNCYLRFVDFDGNVSDLSPVSATVTVNTVTLTYRNVQAPTDLKVVRRQILRNTSGQNTVYYVDVDTTDLSSTQFTSTRTDAQLATQTAVVIANANLFGVPTSERPHLCYHKERVFAAGETAYSEGHVEVTNGSTIVTGVGTEWNGEMGNTRYFYVVGHATPYPISSVSPTLQRIALSKPYLGATDVFAKYVIRIAPASRNLVSYTQAGLGDAWPAIYGFQIEEDGDTITGLSSTSSFLFIFKKKRIYRLTYQSDPGLDGSVWLACSSRGCINNRVWVSANGVTYIMDYRGIYIFRGGEDVEDISLPIRDLFALDRKPGEYRISWEAERWFHAAHDVGSATIRWFVSMGGYYLPRHALCYNYQFQQWWIEEYPYMAGGSSTWNTPKPRVLLGTTSRRIMMLSLTTLDGPDPTAGTTRNDLAKKPPQTITATLNTLTDPNAVFPTTGVVGSPVVIVDGTGKGQLRIVSSVSGTTMTMTQPWMTKPDATSTYQIGGVPWRWKSGWYRYPPTDGAEQKRDINISFEPSTVPDQMDLRIYRDHRTAPEKATVDWPFGDTERDGIEWTKDSADGVIDLTKGNGYVVYEMAQAKSNYLSRGDWIAVELRGVSTTKPVAIQEVNLAGPSQ